VETVNKIMLQNMAQKRVEPKVAGYLYSQLLFVYIARFSIFHVTTIAFPARKRRHSIDFRDVEGTATSRTEFA